MPFRGDGRESFSQGPQRFCEFGIGWCVHLFRAPLQLKVAVAQRGTRSGGPQTGLASRLPQRFEARAPGKLIPQVFSSPVEIGDDLTVRCGDGICSSNFWSC